MIQQISEIYLYAQECWQALISSWWLKSILGVIGSFMIWILELKHVQVLGIFVSLVVLDLVTKWASIAYAMLLDMGAKPENISTISKWQAIPTAFDRGLINSCHMRKPFVKKTLTYVLATLAAVLFDYMAGGINGQSNFAVNLVWLYLGSAEFLSILENLRDGGNELVGKFLELARNKIETKVKL